MLTGAGNGLVNPSRPLYQHRKNPYIVNSVWGIYVYIDTDMFRKKQIAGAGPERNTCQIQTQMVPMYPYILTYTLGEPRPPLYDGDG